MKKLLVVLLLFFSSHAIALPVEITPSEVYTQVVKIDQEVNVLQEHFGITEEKKADVYTARLLPRHVWAKTYMIMVKINVLRNKLGLPRNEPNYTEPELNLSPSLVFEQTQRLLAELHILKKRQGIVSNRATEQVFKNKRHIDVFNMLHHISYQLDVINNEEINPNYVFAEVMRIHEDIIHILRSLQLRDQTYPPGKEKKITPTDSLKASFSLMGEIQRLQRGAGITRTDFSAFNKRDRVLPSDVFNMVSMCLAELQTLKAQTGLKHNVTPPAAYHEGKSTSDVHQLLRWTTRMLRQIRQL